MYIICTSSHHHMYIIHHIYWCTVYVHQYIRHRRHICDINGMWRLLHHSHKYSWTPQFTSMEDAQTWCLTRKPGWYARVPLLTSYEFVTCGTATNYKMWFFFKCGKVYSQEWNMHVFFIYRIDAFQKSCSARENMKAIR